MEAWERVEQAEERLERRAGQRHAARDRRRRRMLALRWTVRVLLPFAGAAAIVGAVEAAGGDLRDWPTGAVLGFLAGGFLVPAVLAGWLARGHGRLEAVAWGVGTLGLEGALVFGVAWTALGLGPT